MSDLEKLTKAVLKQQKFQSGAWAKVVDLARQYALMKLHESIKQGDIMVRVSFSDKLDQLALMNNALLKAAEDALLEDALTGIALSSAASEISA